MVNVSPRWSLTGQARASIAVTEHTERQVSGGLSARVVVGKIGESHEHEHEVEHEHEDEHGHEDAHDHGDP